jgi:hypothetical protein
MKTMTDDRAKAEARARDYLVKRGYDPIWCDTTTDGTNIVSSIAHLILSVQEEAIEYAKNNICQFYPHMCRDEHEEVGFRGDDELCPVDKKLTERDAEVKRVVEEAWATIPALQSPPGLLSTRNEILRRLGLEK